MIEEYSCAAKWKDRPSGWKSRRFSGQNFFLANNLSCEDKDENSIYRDVDDLRTRMEPCILHRSNL